MSFLVLAGALIVILLGVAHAVFTLQSSPAGGPLAPTDANVRSAMTIEGGLGMAPGLAVPLWQPWVGFNLSHSLGVVLGGLVIGLPALTDFEGALGRPEWVAIAWVLPPAYLAISVRYWFQGPTRGIALATVLIATGVAGGLIL